MNFKILPLMFFITSFLEQKSKTHDFRNLEQNIDYFVDFTESGQTATLTTAHRVKEGEIIILLYQERAFTYQVVDLAGYWNDDSIQTILLKKVEQTIYSTENY